VGDWCRGGGPGEVGEAGEAVTGTFAFGEVAAGLVFYLKIYVF
jgi:hypothetical protein